MLTSFVPKTQKDCSRAWFSTLPPTRNIFPWKEYSLLSGQQVETILISLSSLSPKTILLLQHRSLLLQTVMCTVLFVCVSVSYVSLFCSLFTFPFALRHQFWTRTMRLSSTHLTVLSRSLRPKTPDPLVTTPAAPYNRTVKPNRPVFKSALPTRLPGLEIPSVSWKCRPQ